MSHTTVELAIPSLVFSSASATLKMTFQPSDSTASQMRTTTAKGKLYVNSVMNHCENITGNECIQETHTILSNKYHITPRDKLMTAAHLWVRSKANMALRAARGSDRRVITPTGSHHLRSALAAAPVLFAHAVSTAAQKRPPWRACTHLR